MAEPVELETENARLRADLDEAERRIASLEYRHALRWVRHDPEGRIRHLFVDQVWIDRVLADLERFGASGVPSPVGTTPHRLH